MFGLRNANNYRAIVINESGLYSLALSVRGNLIKYSRFIK